MSLNLTIAGQAIHIDAPATVLDAVGERYHRFLAPASQSAGGRAPIRLKIRARPGRFSPTYERPAPIRVREASPGEIAIEGALAGTFRLAARQGYAEEATGLGAVDGLLRIGLSAALPMDGGFLLHAAALGSPREGAIALCGDSGAGKSTAGAALGASCDELVVLRPMPDSVELHATPYWGGSPLRAPCRMAVCLVRGGDPRLLPLEGIAAVRSLLRHVVRYVAIPSIDQAILRLVCRTCERMKVVTAICPEGDAFIPFLKERLFPDTRTP